MAQRPPLAERHGPRHHGDEAHLRVHLNRFTSAERVARLDHRRPHAEQSPPGAVEGAGRRASSARSPGSGSRSSPPRRRGRDRPPPARTARGPGGPCGCGAPAATRPSPRARSRSTPRLAPHLEPEQARGRQQRREAEHGGGHHGGVEEEAGGEQGDEQGEQAHPQRPEQSLAAAESFLRPRCGPRGPARGGDHPATGRPVAAGPASTRGAGTRPTAWSTTCCALRLESRPSVPRITR